LDARRESGIRNEKQGISKEDDGRHEERNISGKHNGNAQLQPEGRIYPEREKGITTKTNDNGTKQRVLQGSRKRLHQATSPSLFDGVYEGGAGGSDRAQGGLLSGSNGIQQQPTGREGSVLQGHANLLTPALVPFNAEDNDTQSFNQSRKYDDNISAIETLITLIKENRKATPDEKTVLSRYVGFGGLKDIVLTTSPVNILSPLSS
jgi:hypothetical protein